MWNIAMTFALRNHNKLGFSDGSCKRDNNNPSLANQWDMRNYVVSDLRETYDKVDGSVVFNLHKSINSLNQNGDPLAEYYNNLNSLWNQFDAIISLPPWKPLVKATFAIISGEGSHRNVTSFGATIPTATALILQPKPLTIKGGQTITIGNTIDRCFKLVDYPAGYVKRSFNSSTRPVSSNNASIDGHTNYAGSNNATTNISLVSLSNEQLSRLTSLLNDNGHPNGTQALITKIGDLKINNDITLYDVLVVPKYIVNLLFVHKIARDNQVLDVLKSTLNLDSQSVSDHLCDTCNKSKQTREPFPFKDGFRYFLTIVDDFFRDVWVYLLKGKDDVYDPLLQKFFNDKWILHQTSCVYSPQHNGIAKRKHMHLLNVAISLMFQGELPLYLWYECIMTVVYHINMIPSSVLSGKSPFYFVYGHDPSLSDFRLSSVDQNDDDSGATSIDENIHPEGNVSDETDISDNFSFAFNFNKSIEPTCYKDDILDSNWIDAMNAKIEALNRDHTCIITDLPANRKPIGCKWIFKIKYKVNGEIERYKARLVAKCFNQREGIDLDETFSPIVKMSTIRCLIAMSVRNKWPFFQLDNNIAFLFGELEDDVYMTIPQGSKDNKFIALLVYVDDIVITGNCVYENDQFKIYLKSKFNIKDLGSLKYFLRIEVIKTGDDICLSQRKYCLELLKEYGLLGCKPVSTHMKPKFVLSYTPTKTDPLLDNITGYQKLLGKLIYLTHTTPDIAYSVHWLAQYMHSPLKSHLNCALNVLRYLKNAPDKGINNKVEGKGSLTLKMSSLLISKGLIVHMDNSQGPYA
ncbi:ribonuclease H-like domain-containing protein [Tanacetum coccineum]